MAKVRRAGATPQELIDWANERKRAHLRQAMADALLRALERGPVAPWSQT